MRASLLRVVTTVAGTGVLALTATCALGKNVGLPVAAPQTVEAAAHDALVDQLAAVLTARGAQAVVTVAPDARRTPAPCARLEGFLPPGARLSGRTLVGVRCADGTVWQAFVTAEVRVDAPVWQTTRALRAGETIGQADVAPAALPMSTVDLDAALAAARGGATPTNNLRGLASLDGRAAPPIGRVVLRPVAMGRALTASDVRDEGRANAGDTVRVVYQGEGFAVASEGRLVAASDPGGAVQVRLASGGVVSGLLRADHQVELPR